MNTDKVSAEWIKAQLELEHAEFIMGQKKDRANGLKLQLQETMLENNHPSISIVDEASGERRNVSIVHRKTVKLADGYTMESLTQIITELMNSGSWDDEVIKTKLSLTDLNTAINRIINENDGDATAVPEAVRNSIEMNEITSIRVMKPNK